MKYSRASSALALSSQVRYGFLGFRSIGLIDLDLILEPIYGEGYGTYSRRA